MISRSEERAVKDSRRRQIRLGGGIVAAFALVILGIGWNSAQIHSLSHQRDSAVSEKSSATAVATAQASIANKGKALAADVAQKCKTDTGFRKDNPTLCPRASQLATATPSIVTGPSGPPGPGPSDQQVQSAVNTYLGLHPPPINYILLQSFVNSYLVTHPAPSGPAGPAGSSGVSGASGSNGAPGHDATGVQGQAGENGGPGPAGADAPKVTSIQANDSGTELVFTFDTGAAISVPINLPNNCPSTRTVTPPDAPLGKEGDPSTPYLVCVPQTSPS